MEKHDTISIGMKQKKKYVNLAIEMLDCPLEGAVLDASLTSVPLEVSEVEVDGYDNGFGPDPFEGISFD